MLLLCYVTNRLFEKLGTPAGSKTLSIRDNMRHEYSTEKLEMREDVIRSFVEFSNKYCPEGAGASATAGTKEDPKSDLENVRLSGVKALGGAPRLMVPM